MASSCSPLAATLLPAAAAGVSIGAGLGVDQLATGWSWTVLVLIAVLGACAGVVLVTVAHPLGSHTVVVAVKEVSLRQVMLAALALVGVACNVVNWVLLLLMVFVGVLLPRLLREVSKQ